MIVYCAFEAAGKLYQPTRLPLVLANGVPCFHENIDNFIAKQELEKTFL